MALVKCDDGVWREGGTTASYTSEMTIQELADEFGYIDDQYVSGEMVELWDRHPAERPRQRVKRYARWSDI